VKLPLDVGICRERKASILVGVEESKCKAEKVEDHRMLDSMKISILRERLEENSSDHVQLPSQMDWRWEDGGYIAYCMAAAADAS